MHYQEIHNGSTGLKTIVAFFPEEEEPLVSVTSDHPHYTSIVRGLSENDQTVYGLFNLAKGINERFRSADDKIGQRYTIRNGVFYRDLDPVDDALAEQVLRFVEEGVDDWKPLIRFMERCDANPSEDSRKQLMQWVGAGKLTITEQGLCVGYKACTKAEDGWKSTYAGIGVVDGVEQNGYLPNKPGSVVEIPRSKVDTNPRNHCSAGLHVGTYEYAKWFKAQGKSREILEVHFDPADAVAVPTDHSAKKIRVIRYKVIGLRETPYTGPVRPLDDFQSVEAATRGRNYYDDKDVPDNF